MKPGRHAVPSAAQLHDSVSNFIMGARGSGGEG